ncbi:cytoskeletal protein-binding protein SLA1 [Aspergillus mulundensis]|uniref:Actin cytoskeleton-regulatory complex protein SLA1 n=1 Tax=Aspergillus mulundensis TaxID=1810919 RepID=A0A3D8S607_9EURO|nr:hypothetical protein DSM5745_05304 [Aspergillus mulundensis]RDW81747.1 hypothetical protein DSM5745_05304 [Aspergillus mulundensis]
MGFIGVYTAIYDYQPQAHGELELREGDLLYILEKSAEDDWWKAKKKADRDDEDEPEGLVPNNYVEEATPVHTAKALYDYTRQTDEEVSFSEDANLVVYDTSDPDWTLVGVNTDFGFAPSNYIDILEDSVAPNHASPEPPSPAAASPIPVPEPPSLPQRPGPAPIEEPRSPVSSSPGDAVQNPAAAAIASILHQQNLSPGSSRDVPPPPQPQAQPESQYREPSPSPPRLPERPRSEQVSSPVRLESSAPSPIPHPQPVSIRENDGGPRESPPYNRVGRTAPRSPSGYHMYNINEMVEVMGKRKKMPTTLGINIATGTIFISPEDDGDVQEWTAEKLTHYSIEGKHVFIDLVRPSKSVDFHAGAKDTAREIVSALGEISGAFRAEGLREVIAAGAGGGGAQKKGNILYDFMAQGDDEVTVGVGDEVIILDDTKSEEWWMVRRIKNGKEGVVPSSYVEVSGFVSPPPTTTPIVLEEIRAAAPQSPTRQHHKKDSKSSPRSKPDPAKVRTWIDRSKAFTVEAQFIGLQDGKIHLHKTNGIKIAVPIPKMSFEDLEYVEKVTGESLDEDKPLSDHIRRKSQQPKPDKTDKVRASNDGKSGATFQQSDYDWFDFFLKAGVGPHQCERYAQNFAKDSMDEGILPDITPETLRTLGLKEGDILRVMRYLDNMFGRTGGKSKLRNVSFGGEEVLGNGDGSGGLFAGPGGTLHNNTTRPRPAPAVQTKDVVDPKVFEQKDAAKPAETPSSSTPPPAPTAPIEKPVQKGFDDDAWEVKTTKQPTGPAPAVSSPPAATPAAASPPPVQPAITGAMADLSLLQAPLQPTPAQPAPAPAQSPPAAQPIQAQPTAIPAPQPQQSGASPNFFAQVAQVGQQQPMQTGFQQPRQRPQAPQGMGQNSLIPPPPQRPLSAPQNMPQQQPFGLPQLQPQLTGLPQQGPQLAAPGQSLASLGQQGFQPPQQGFQPPFQPQQTGFMAPNQFQNGLMPQPTGFQPQSQFGIQQQQTGFGLAPQQTSFGGFGAPPQQPMATGINSVLPPALQPQPTGLNGSGSMAYSPSPPPIPPIPQQHTIAPLQAQKTGPAPPVRFGVKPDAPKKLAPQPTGMKANLSQATPTNPFGF